MEVAAQACERFEADAETEALCAACRWPVHFHTPSSPSSAQEAPSPRKASPRLSQTPMRSSGVWGARPSEVKRKKKTKQRKKKKRERNSFANVGVLVRVTGAAKARFCSALVDARVAASLQAAAGAGGGGVAQRGGRHAAARRQAGARRAGRRRILVRERSRHGARAHASSQSVALRRDRDGTTAAQLGLFGQRGNARRLCRRAGQILFLCGAAGAGVGGPIAGARNCGVGPAAERRAATVRRRENARGNSARMRVEIRLSNNLALRRLLCARCRRRAVGNHGHQKICRLLRVASALVKKVRNEKRDRKMLSKEAQVCCSFVACSPKGKARQQ
jgi:hypothetical protein